MICRIFVGIVNTEGKTLLRNGDGENRWQPGRNGVVYVIDENAIKSIRKHRNITGTAADGAEAAIDAQRLVNSEFRKGYGYAIQEFLDKVVKPVHLKESMGITTDFPSDNEELIELARSWRIDVAVPDNADTIPTPAFGMIIPAPYGKDKKPGNIEDIADEFD